MTSPPTAMFFLTPETDILKATSGTRWGGQGSKLDSLVVKDTQGGCGSTSVVSAQKFYLVAKLEGMVFDQTERRTQPMSRVHWAQVKPIKFLSGRRRIFGNGGDDCPFPKKTPPNTFRRK